ncbi:MAG: hypothetical protein V1909_03955 [Candidatus Micrarchaeota archaeon]
MPLHLPGFLRNPSAVMLYCIALAFLSFLVISPDGETSIVIFILVALMTFLVRPVYDMHTKTICYLLLGMLLYWAFGNALVSSGPLPYFPLPMILALTSIGAIIALVTYSDSKLSGHIFSAGALVLMFFANKDVWSITVSLLVFLSAYTLSAFISKIKAREDFLKNALAGAIASGLILSLAGFVIVESGVALGVYPMLFDINSSIGVGVFWVLLASVAFILPALYAFDIVLSSIKLVRFVEDERVLYGTKEEPICTMSTPPIPPEREQTITGLKKAKGLKFPKAKKDI